MRYLPVLNGYKKHRTGENGDSNFFVAVINSVLTNNTPLCFNGTFAPVCRSSSQVGYSLQIVREVAVASILIIDDSAYIRSKIRETVMIDGHDVMEAQDGLSGLQTACTRKPDCIILDLIMPGMDGLKILKTLHSQGAKIPVIVVTADIQVSVQKRCLALGAVALLNKPPQERKLLKAVREVLSTKGKCAAIRQPTPRHIDVLKELVNIGIGRAAASLNELVKHHVSLEVPFVRVLTPAQYRREMEDLGDKKMATVKIGFEGSFSGTAALVVSLASASKLVSVLTGGAASSALRLNAVGEETLREVGNIVINGIMGSMGNTLKQHLTYTLPSYIVENTARELLLSEKIGNDTVFLLIRTRFKVRELEVEGNIIILFTVGAFDILLSAIDDLK